MSTRLFVSYASEDRAVVEPFTKHLEAAGMSRRLELPHRRFHRHQGLYAGHHFDPAGELISAAVEAGARRVIVGVGGSATTDAGSSWAWGPAGTKTEAQLDRFVLRTSVGAPSADDEIEMVRRRLARRTDHATVAPAIDLHTVRRLQATVEQIEVAEPLIAYIVALVRATRTSPQVHSGASPRGVEALVKLARARALLGGRGYATPDDVKAVAIPALGHRIIVRPELWVRGTSGDDVVREVLATVPTPSTLPLES